MKNVDSISKWIAGLLLISGSWGLSAQEYDDLYFSKKDRKKVSYELKNTSDDSRAVYEAYTNNNYAEDYTAREVNPEYIARYASQNQTDVEEGNDNPNYGVYNEYYPEEEINDDPVIINNYYGTNFNSPWVAQRWRPWGTFGYSPWYGWNWNVGFSFGSGWYDPWFYDPWYDPFFYRPSYAWNDPFYNPFWGSRFGYNPWRWRSFTSYNHGYYNGFYSGYAYAGNDLRISTRQVYRGGRNSRGGVIIGNSRSSNSSSRAVAVSDRSRGSAGRRDYSGTQNEYYNRSRRSSTNDSFSRTRSSTASSARSSSESSRTGVSTGNRTYNSRSGTSTYSGSNRSRSGSATSNARIGSSSSRRYSSSANRSRSGNNNRSFNYGSGSGNRSRSSGFSSGSSNRSRSFSSGSSSSGRSYSSGSRSSSGSNRSSGSRSSGSSRSNRGNN